MHKRGVINLSNTVVFAEKFVCKDRGILLASDSMANRSIRDKAITNTRLHLVLFQLVTHAIYPKYHGYLCYYSY